MFHQTFPHTTSPRWRGGTPHKGTLWLLQPRCQTEAELEESAEEEWFLASTVSANETVGPISRLPFWHEWTPQAAPARFTTPLSQMDTCHASTATMESNRRSHTGVLLFAGPRLSNPTSLPSPCSYLPRLRSTNRGSLTTEEEYFWTWEGVSLIVFSGRKMPLKQCSGFEVADLCKKTQPIMWHPVSLWTKASTKLVFPPKPLFVQRISLYHIGIAQLLAYYRTADSGDVMPPPCQCPQCGFTKQLKFSDPLMLGKTEHISHLED